jgi:Zn-finger nucleic acid-binding protein
MICPACKQEMIVVEYEQIELDICVSCRGVWFDGEELDLLLDSLDFLDLKVTDLFRPPSGKTKEKARRCPYCRGKMEKVQTGPADKDVTIDRCSKGHGLWFDGGELDTVINSLQRPAATDKPDGGDAEPDKAQGGVGSFLADVLLTGEEKGTDENGGPET